MKRGFLLLLGSVVALAIVAVGAQLDPGHHHHHEEAVEEQQQQQQQNGQPTHRFQYLPGEGQGTRRRTSHKQRKGGRGGSRTRVPQGGPDASVPSPLPEEFAGAFEGDSSAAPGEPGVDYPNYSDIPVTSFSCEGRIAGYYADPETQCQVFHVCSPGGSTSNSFLCPNGTLFNPDVRTCDWWPSVDCGTTSESLRINHVGKKVKNKSQSAQSLLGSPGTRLKSHRNHYRQQLPPVRRPPSNEVFSQDTYQSTERSSIKFDPQQSQPLEYKESPPSQTPLTTITAEQGRNKQRARQEYSVGEYSGQELVIKRRPSGSKRLSNQSLKRKQNIRTTTPAVPNIAQYAEGDDYSIQITTVRPTLGRQDNWPPRSHSVTRFNPTSETLDFPSFRYTPGSTTYQTPTITTTDEPRLPIIVNPTPIRTHAASPYRVSYSVQGEDTFPGLQITTTSSPYPEKIEYKTTRIVTQPPTTHKPRMRTQPPTTNRPRIRTQPANERLKPKNFQTPLTTNELNQQSTPRRPIVTTSEITTSFVQTTPRADRFIGTSMSNEQQFLNSVSSTIATRTEDERVVRPIVVASPRPEINTFGTNKRLKAFPSGFMAAQPVLESFRPLTEDVQPSKTIFDVKGNEPETRQGFSTAIASSFAQSFSDPGNSRGTTIQDSSTSQSFAQSSATSGDLQYSSGEDFTPPSARAARPVTEYRPDLTSNQPDGKETTVTLPENNKEFNSFSSSFAQSFAGADAFVSDEGFRQTSPVSTTLFSKPVPRPTTFRPLNLLTVRATARPTTTTIKAVYTPTVPQTTARPTTTTPAPKLVSSTTTTTKPITTVAAPFASTARTSPTPRPISFTTIAKEPSSTTKKPKGFFITVAPSAKPSTLQPALQEDKAPIDNSLSYPTNAYLPNPTESSPSSQFSPALFYQPTRPGVVPDSYFSSYSKTQYPSTTAANVSPKISPDTIYNSDVVIDPIETPVKSTSFEIKIPESFNGSRFMLNPTATYEYQPQYSSHIQFPSISSELPQTEQQISTSKQEKHGTTEPPFVIQKSVELFAAHELAYHPSVYSQPSYSLSSLQDGYRIENDDQSDFRPPPYLEPSPHARGFGNWNTDGNEEKRKPVKS